MIQQQETYQGWTNYQTWAIKLWIDNEQSTYTLWCDRALEIRNMGADCLTEPNPFMDEDRQRTFQLADELQVWHRENMPELNGFAADLFEYAFEQVNWLEIAQSLIEG